MTLSMIDLIVTISIMTLSIITLSINDIQHNDTQHDILNCDNQHKRHLVY